MNILINEKGEVMVIDWNSAAVLGKKKIEVQGPYMIPGETILDQSSDTTGLVMVIQYGFSGLPEYRASTGMIKYLRNFIAHSTCTKPKMLCFALSSKLYSPVTADRLMPPCLPCL